MRRGIISAWIIAYARSFVRSREIETPAVDAMVLRYHKCLRDVSKLIIANG